MAAKDHGPLTRDEALGFMLNNWVPDNGTEWVPLSEALGRVTAETLYSCNTLPVCRISGADGIAVKSAAFENGTPDISKWVKGVDYAQADTGDDFPDEFDTVVTVEDLLKSEDGDLLGFGDEFEFIKGDCIRAAGTMVRAGDELVRANTRIEPLHLAVLALGGIVELKVVRKPRVTYIPTGNELITAGMKPGRGDHIETNGLYVKATLEQWGANAVCYPIIRDDTEDLETALDSALESSDIVLINGGSSKGEDDLNAVLLQRRAELYSHGIKMRPGKPVAIAFIGGKIVINLPGPTLATWLAMDWCVSALVHRFLNIPAPKRQTVKAKLEKPIKKEPEWEMFGRFVLEKDSGCGFTARQIGRGGGTVEGLLAPNAAYVVPLEVSELPAGTEIDAEVICGWEYLT